MHGPALCPGTHLHGLIISSKVYAWLSSLGKPSMRKSLAPDVIMALRSRQIITCTGGERSSQDMQKSGADVVQGINQKVLSARAEHGAAQQTNDHLRRRGAQQIGMQKLGADVVRGVYQEALGAGPDHGVAQQTYNHLRRQEQIGNAEVRR